MVCKSCGYENPKKNRYCGMCGVRLETTAEPAKDAPASKSASHPAASAAGSSSCILGLNREAAPPPPDRPRPIVTGFSFLGLNSEPDPSSYLLDEEEDGGGHRGLWTTLGLLVALAAAGFYFRAELKAWAAPLLAAVLNRVTPQPPVPVAPPAAPAATDSATATTSAPPPAKSDAPPAAGVSPSLVPEEKSADVKSTEPAKPAADTAEAVTEKTEPGRYTRASHPKPRVAETVSPENDPLLKLAQKYIRGEGVRADCATGMAYLREATKRSNPEAASQMGALYATGTCVPLDRVAAYRWFTSAMRMTPDNPWLARERDELYGQMTSAERSQADRQ